MREYVLLACVVALFIVATVLAATSVHNIHEKTAWRGRYEALHAQFQRHMRCMDSSGCNARAIAPH